MDLWPWALVLSDLPISAGSSTSVNVLSDRQQLAVTYIVWTAPGPEPSEPEV